MTEFHKFPSTPHLLDASGQLTRGDKLLSVSEAASFYEHSIVVEEKVDGANIGFSLSEAGEILIQNRGAYIHSHTHPQFGRLDEWLYRHGDALFDFLIEHDVILFGEWCYAKHSIHYIKLPDWFLAFDVWDRQTGRYWSRNKRHESMKELGIEEVPLLAEGTFSESELRGMLKRTSCLSDELLEGVYLRIDQEGYLNKRAKIVRNDFLQTTEGHWSKNHLIKNRVIDRFNE